MATIANNRIEYGKDNGKDAAGNRKPPTLFIFEAGQEVKGIPAEVIQSLVDCGAASDSAVPAGDEADK